MSQETWRKSQLGQLGARFLEKHLGAEDAQVAFYRAVSIENKWLKPSPPLKKYLPNLGQSCVL